MASELTAVDFGEITNRYTRTSNSFNRRIQALVNVKGTPATDSSNDPIAESDRLKLEACDEMVNNLSIFELGNDVRKRYKKIKRKEENSLNFAAAYGMAIADGKVSPEEILLLNKLANKVKDRFSIAYKVAAADGTISPEEMAAFKKLVEVEDKFTPTEK